MNRIFHARVPWYTLLFLFLLGSMTVWAYWQRLGLPVAVILLLMVILVERTIHTTYTVTADGRLVVARGRFVRTRSIPLIEITRIERIQRPRLWNVALNDYLLVHYGSGRTLSLIPAKGDELVACISRLRAMSEELHDE